MEPDESLQYPENVQREEPVKDLLAQIYKELGATSYQVHKEKRVDVYLPRIDILSILGPEQISFFEGTMFQYLRPVVCFEAHNRSLDEITFAKWQIELIGLFLMIMKELGFHYKDFVGFSILEHVPEKIFDLIDQQAIIPVDPEGKDQPCLVKIAGMIPWFFILKPCLRYDLFCLPANLMVPERHSQLIADIKQHKYQAGSMLEEMVIKVLGRHYQSKGETTMLDIGSVLEKSNDPTFVQYRKCRDMLLNEGERKGELKGELKGKLEDLFKILKARFGDISDDPRQKLQAIDSVKRLDGLFDLALAVTTIEAFVSQAKL